MDPRYWGPLRVVSNLGSIAWLKDLSSNKIFQVHHDRIKHMDDISFKDNGSKESPYPEGVDLTSNQLRMEECQENGKPPLTPRVDPSLVQARGTSDVTGNTADVTQDNTAGQLVNFQETDSLTDCDEENGSILNDNPQKHRYPIRGKVTVNSIQK